MVENLKTDLNELINQSNIREFRNEFLKLHAYQQSEYFGFLTSKKRELLFKILSAKDIAHFWSYLELDSNQEKLIFDEMDENYASKVLEYMSDDDAVDILNKLSKRQRVNLLSLINNHKSEQLKLLLNYQDDTAGGIMTKEYVSLSSNMNVKEALLHVKSLSSSAQTIYVLYVVDDQEKLLAVISLRDLINAEMDDYIVNVMSTNIISVNITEDQEYVAQTIKDYDLIAIPVVDNDRYLMGIITVDDILDVMEAEASEDYSKLAGVNDAKETKALIFQTAKHRLPWLILLTFLGMITATILGAFEDTLEKVALLAAFIPIISGMSGNTGTQALAVSVRGISTGTLQKESKFKHALNESASGLISGIICSLILFTIIVILYGQPLLATIVGVSLTAAMTIGTTIGSCIPLFMDKIGIDPAVASGPFITTINDIVSMLIYFSLATSFMSLLV